MKILVICLIPIKLKLNFNFSLYSLFFSMINVICSIISIKIPFTSLFCAATPSNGELHNRYSSYSTPLVALRRDKPASSPQRRAWKPMQEPDW